MVCGCADPYGRRVLGDVRTSTVHDVWNGSVVSTLRAELNQGGSKFCGDCPLKLPLKKDDAVATRPLEETSQGAMAGGTGDRSWLLDTGPRLLGIQFLSEHLKQPLCRSLPNLVASPPEAKHSGLDVAVEVDRHPNRSDRLRFCAARRACDPGHPEADARAGHLARTGGHRANDRLADGAVFFDYSLRHPEGVALDVIVIRDDSA